MFKWSNGQKIARELGLWRKKKKIKKKVPKANELFFRIHYITVQIA